MDAAEQALKKKDFLFQTYISTEELAIEEFAPVLNEFLSEYGVQAHNIISLGGGYWDAWDAEGNFYGGSMCEFEAAITDGQNSRTVTRVIMFGVRGDKIYGPGGAKE